MVLFCCYNRTVNVQCKFLHKCIFLCTCRGCREWTVGLDRLEYRECGDRRVHQGRRDRRDREGDRGSEGLPGRGVRAVPRDTPGLRAHPGGRESVGSRGRRAPRAGTGSGSWDPPGPPDHLDLQDPQAPPALTALLEVTALLAVTEIMGVTQVRTLKGCCLLPLFLLWVGHGQFEVSLQLGFTSNIQVGSG